MAQPIKLPEELSVQYKKYVEEMAHLRENAMKVSDALESEQLVRRTRHITRREIASFSPLTPTYRQVGRFFLSESPAHMADRLRGELGRHDQTILQLKKTAVVISMQLENVRDQLSDLVRPFLQK